MTSTLVSQGPFARRPPPTGVPVDAWGFRERLGPAAATRARAATPYTAATSQYTRAGSTLPSAAEEEALGEVDGAVQQGGDQHAARVWR